MTSFLTPPSRYISSVLLVCLWFLPVTGKLQAETFFQDKTILHSFGYFSRQPQLDPVIFILLDTLQRRFDFRIKHAVLNEKYLQQPAFRLFSRLLNQPLPASISRVSTEQIHALSSPIDRFTLQALHCQQFPLPENYLSQLQQASQRSAYTLTHAAMAGQWLLENQCLKPASLQTLRIQQREALIQQVEKHAVNLNDVAIESIVMLYYMGYDEHIQKQWLDVLRQQQNSDGGWAENATLKHSSQHTSILALWVLLESQYPERKIPMIPQH